MLHHWLRSLTAGFRARSRTHRRPALKRRRTRLAFYLETLENRVVPADFGGGVMVAGGDIDGDGLAEVVTAAGPGGGPHVKIFSGATGGIINEFMAYDPAFTGGVNVAVGRVTGAANAEIITGAGAGATPHVKVFNGQTGEVVRSFLAYDAGFNGGVHVAAGDVNGDGLADIITGAGAGAASHIKVFDGATNNEIASFLAYDTGFAGGATVGAVDTNGDGQFEVITGAGAGGGPHVKVFNALTGELVSSFFAYDTGFSGGVRVAGGASGSAEIMTAAGPGGGPHVKVYNSAAVETNGFMAYDIGFTGGVSVTSLGVGDGGSGAIATGAGAGGPSQVQLFTTTTQTSYSAFSAYDPEKPPTSGFNATISNDRVAPTIRIISPASGQVFTTNPTITGIVSDDDSGVRTLEAQVDGGAFSSVSFDSSGSFSFTTSLPTTGSATGAHTVTFRVRDKGGNTATANFSFTLDQAPVVTTPIADVNVAVSATPTVIDLNNHFSDPDVDIAANTIVRLDTNFGAVDIRLFDDTAPETVKNFLAYVNSGRYTNTFVHRSVSGFVVQTGGFTFDESFNDFAEVPTDSPVVNEFGASNLRGTIAMAKLGSDPNSATSQFFFNLGDNSGNLDNQNGGFTVFAEVVGDGMTIIDQMAAVPTQDLSEIDGAFTDLPLQNYSGVDFPFDATKDNFVIINSATVTQSGGGGGGASGLAYSVSSNSNSNLVTASISNNNLTLTYAAGQTGTATITIKATDEFGLSVESTFTVTVA